MVGEKDKWRGHGRRAKLEFRHVIYFLDFDSNEQQEMSQLPDETLHKVDP
jgi:hypothetical protein